MPLVQDEMETQLEDMETQIEENEETQDVEEEEEDQETQELEEDEEEAPKKDKGKGKEGEEGKQKKEPIRYVHVPGHSVIPASRVTRVLKADEELCMVQKEAHFLISLCAEEFIKKFMDAGNRVAMRESRNTVRYSDMATCLRRIDEFLFMEEVVPWVKPDPPNRPQETKPKKKKSKPKKKEQETEEPVKNSSTNNNDGRTTEPQEEQKLEQATLARFAYKANPEPVKDTEIDTADVREPSDDDELPANLLQRDL